VSSAMAGNSIVVKSCGVRNEYNVALHDRNEPSTVGKAHTTKAGHCGELYRSCREVARFDCR
jgi:hypothetical protein